MLQKIKIENYKSVVSLELELGRVNVFIGENGCGKTNILEGIALAAAAAGNKLDNEFLVARGIRVTENELMRSAFVRNGNPINVEITGKTGRRGAFQFSITSKKNSLTWELKQGESLLGRGWGLDISNFLNYAPENYFLRRFEEEGQIRPLGIRGEGLFKHLTDIYKKKPEILAKIGEKLRLMGWFQGFEIPKDLMFTERRINIKDKYLQELDFFDQRSANEGFLYLLFYFTLFISESTPSFFAIDNIDNALNPKLCQELIKQLTQLAQEHNKQTIVTTHNPAILDGLDLTDDMQRLFTIYRNADGHTIAKRIIPKKTPEGIEPVRLSEAYIRGYLGGLPKNF